MDHIRSTTKWIYLLYLVCLFQLAGGNVDIKEISHKLSHEVEIIRTEELGVPFIEKLFRNFKVSTTINPVSSQLKSIVHKLEGKINRVFSGMDNASRFIDELTISDASSVLLPCITERSGALDVLIGSNLINKTNADEYFGSKHSLQEMKKNISQHKPLENALKQLYFISDRDNRMNQYSQFAECSGHEEATIWKNYMSHQQYVTKHLVIVLDHGGSLSKRQLQVAKQIAKEMLGSLKETDQVALIAVASDWSYQEIKCSSDRKIVTKQNVSMMAAKTSYLLQLNNFVDSLVRGTGATNHVIGMQKALEIISNQSDLQSTDITAVAYISRGLLSSLTEVRSVLKVMAQQTDAIKAPLYIHTCAVIDELRPVMYETHFLRDIAEQNFTKHNVSHIVNSNRRQGFMLTVNKTEDIGFVINRFFSIFNIENKFYDTKTISMPHWDPQSRDFTISFTSGAVSNDNFTMLGVDLYFSNIAEDVAYFSSNRQYSYAFLMDMQGRVVVHPSILRESIIDRQLLFVDIKYIETPSDVNLLRIKMLSEVTGNFVTKNNASQEVEYNWMHVSDWYVICIVLNRDYGTFNNAYKASPSSSVRKLLYQNLDGSENHKFCRHLAQIATLDVASLYLSKSCFQSPFLASRTTQGGFIGQGYLAYLKDETGLIINPGLKKEIKDEVSALGHILDYLRKRHLSSEMSKYIVRRYASSYSGVLQMFPGSVLSGGLEITKRPWFVRALHHRGKAIFIPPYLDKGGAGYIVTVAYALPHLVVAMDLTYGYMLKLLLKSMPYCLNDKISCFLIDDQGYIIYHRNLTDINGARPVEQQHIVHRESLVANDILNHKSFIRKMLCTQYGDNTVQRYYRLNTSFTEDLVNHVPGEHCVSYHITSIPDTNLFVGIVNASCDVVPAFCPCNIVDRLCLNCNRMEQKECECPCECPLETDCNQNITDAMSCQWNAEEDIDTNRGLFTMDSDNSLEACFPLSCQSERNLEDCIGVLGCEWCRYDINSDPLKKPFCSTITTCFNGMYGSSPPYRGHIQELPPTTDSEYSPLGPILGLIVAMVLLFILLYICYRSYTNPAVDRIYLQDQLRMSDLNVTETFHDSNHRDKLLKEDCNPAPSPYCVASHYRRNNTAAESDHGYSTMTPHDESEHLSLAPMEPESLDDEVVSDSTSVHTPRNKPARLVTTPMFTKIPQKNCVIVPVTVHRNMETS